MNRPDLRELECFVAVAEELSFARAAARIHLSQPPLSRHIRQLEEKLGVTLLLRNTRSVELTAQGAVFLEDARYLLHHLDRAVDTVQHVTGDGFEVLNIGFVGATLQSDMIDILRAFRSAHPRCQVRLHDLSGPELLAALGDRRIDGAFVATKPARLSRELEMILWKSEPLMVAVSATHPLAKQKAIALEDLREENWVLIERRVAPSFYREILQLCSTRGFRPRLIQESPKIPALLAMVALGEGVTVLYESTTTRPTPHVVFLPLIKPRFLIPHAFVFRKADESPALHQLITALKAK
ncbi:MAG: LysR substrate-binding domain-containing protein [Chthoniobacteraceae bacterium]